MACHNNNKSACIFWGDAWFSPLQNHSVRECFANPHKIDFYSYSFTRASTADVPFVVNQLLNIEQQQESLYSHMSQANQLPPWAICKSWIRNLLCLEQAVTAVHQQPQCNQYQQILLINHGVQLMSLFDFDNHKPSNLLYASSLRMFGFNANWMLVDQVTFAKLTDITSKLENIVRDPSVNFFQPGDLIWQLLHTQSIVCEPTDVDVRLALYQLNGACKIV